MAIRSSIPSKLGWRTNGSADAHTEIPNDDINDDWNGSDEVQTRRVSSGRVLQAGHVVEFGGTINDFRHWAALLTPLVAGTLLEWLLTYDDGATGTLGKSRHTMALVLGSDLSQAVAYYGDAGAAGDPDSQPGNWTLIGDIFDPSNIEVTVRTRDDALRRPYKGAGHWQADHELLFLEDSQMVALQTMATTDPTPLKALAIGDTFGEWVIFDKLAFRVRREFGGGDNDSQGFYLGFSVSEGTFANAVTMPADPCRFYNEFRLTIRSGTKKALSTIWTETAPT